MLPRTFSPLSQRDSFPTLNPASFASMPNPEINLLVDQLFRQESGKLLAVLTRVFGTENLELVEDVVQDALLEAIDQWQNSAVPDNPSAWLFRVAKNKALNVLHREKYKRQYAQYASYFQEATQTNNSELFSDQEIQDDQLRMIFACCHPAISPDSQIALALKTLCRFSIPEIAKAYLTTEENIHKRLVRARQSIREAQVPFEIPQGEELENRLQTVLEAIYLLFNEGYSASKGNDIVRYEMCTEAIRLAHFLENSPSIHEKGNVLALLSLMYLNASRFKARQDEEGNLLTMAEQNRALWDKRLLQSGFMYWERAMADTISWGLYHVLASISGAHCIAQEYADTDWENILSLYESLLVIDNSPIVLLNRAVALSKVKGPEMALVELEAIKDQPALDSYHLFYSTQAEFFMESRQWERAILSLQKASDLASLPAEKELLARRMAFCRESM